MRTAHTTCSEASDLMARIAAHVGPYTVRGKIEVAGMLIGLSPTQARRLYYREWKTVPAHVMDRLRALYHETCESLEAKARQLNEDTHEADPGSDCGSACVDGLGDAESGNGADRAVGTDDGQAND